MGGLLNMMSVFETFDFCDGNWWVAMFLQLIYGLLTLVSKIMGLFADLLHIAFYIFAGIDINSKATGVEGIYNIEVAEGRKNILDYFLFSESMTKAYIYLAVVGLLLVVIFTIYRIIKQDYFDRAGPRSKGPIFRNVAISCISFVLVIPIFYLIIHSSSLLAVSVMKAMGMSADEFAGAKIFKLSWSDNGYLMGMVNKELSDSSTMDPSKFNWMWDLNGQTLFTTMADGKYVKYDSTVMRLLSPGYQTGSDTQIARWEGKLGVLNASGEVVTADFYWYVYLVGIWAALPVLKDMIFAMIQRIFKLMALFLVAPAPISRYVLDDGATYKRWQKQSIEQGLRVVSATMSFSIYLIALNLISNIDFIVPFKNAVDSARTPDDNEAKLNLMTNLLSTGRDITENGLRNLANPILTQTADSASFVGIKGTGVSVNPLEALANVFMRIVLIMGAGGAVRDIDGVVSNMLIDAQGSLDSGNTGKGLGDGMGMVSNIANTAVGMGVGAVKGLAGFAAGTVGALKGAQEGAEEIDKQERKGREDGIKEANQEDVKSGLKLDENTGNQNPQETPNGNGDNVNAPKEVNAPENVNKDDNIDGVENVDENNQPENKDTDGVENVDENNQPENKDTDGVENVDEDVNPTDKNKKPNDTEKTKGEQQTQGDANKTAGGKPKKGLKMDTRTSKQAANRIAKIKTGFLGKRIASQIGKGMVRAPLHLFDKVAGLAAQGTDALLGRIGFKTNLASQYKTLRDGVTTDVKNKYDTAKKNTLEDAKKSAQKGYEHHKAQGYVDAKKHNMQIAQGVMNDKSEVVQEDSEQLKHAILNETQAGKEVGKVQGEVDAAKSIAQQANANTPVAQEITKIQNDIKPQQEENQQIASKYSMYKSEDINARVQELSKKGQRTKEEEQEYQDLQKFQSNQVQINEGNKKIQELETKQKQTDIFTNKNGVVSQALIKAGVKEKDIANMSFEEIKKVIDENDSIPQELKTVFSTKGAKTMFNSAAISTAREANNNVVSAQQRLQVAQTKYQTAQQETATRRKNLQKSVTELGNSQRVASKIYKSMEESSHFYDNNGHEQSSEFGKIRAVKMKKHLDTIGGRLQKGNIDGTKVLVDEMNENLQEKPIGVNGQGVGASNYISKAISENETTFQKFAQGYGSDVNVPVDTGIIDTYTQKNSHYLVNDFNSGISTALNKLPNKKNGDIKESARIRNEIHTKLNKVKDENGNYNMTELAKLFANNGAGLGIKNKAVLESLMSTYNEFNNSVISKRSKTREKFGIPTATTTLNQVMEEHRDKETGLVDVDAVRNTIIQRGGMNDDIGQKLDTYSYHQTGYENRRQILTTANTMMQPVSQASHNIVQQQQANQRRFDACRGVVSDMNEIINSGGANITVQQRDNLSKLVGTHITTKDPETIVELATQVRNSQVQQQQSIIKNFDSKQHEYNDLLSSLTEMLNSVKDVLSTGGSGKDKDTINKISSTIVNNMNNGTSTLSVDGRPVQGMSAQELSIERYQTQMSEQMKQMMEKASEIDKQMIQDITEIKEKVVNDDN